MAKSVKKVSKPARARATAARTKKKPAATTKKAAKPKRATTKAAASGVHVPRRAIFIDVENTSSEAALFETIESLHIDRSVQPTELAAVGNWRAVGQGVGRRLGALGAQLVHSAPARGVRDWSDLWIAVAAGCWLGQAAAGDTLEIVSNDRAFDAVGDAAAARGVIFHRLLHRHGTVAAATHSAEPRAPRPRGGRRRGGRGRGTRVSPAVTAPVRPSVAPAHAPADGTPHGASAVQISELIRRLTHGEPARWVNLDVLEKALKAEGFSRPPGSPRLVTRLRTLKEMEIDSHGRVRLRQAPASAEEAS